MNEEMPIEDFESWVYSNKELEQVLPESVYLDLIAFGYKEKGAKYELFHLLLNLVDAGEYETARIRSMLEKALKKRESYPELLMEFYHLYSDGYKFLQQLGTVYGLEVIAPRVTGYTGSWKDLNKEQQQTLLDSFSPQIDEEIKKVIDWIDQKKIVLTGRRSNDSYNYYEYYDYRNN